MTGFPLDFSRPRKIALVSEHYLPRFGGIELHVHDLALQLRRAGHSIRVITTFPGPERIDSIHVHRFRVPLFPIWKVAYTPRGILALEDLLRRERFDVVHGHYSVFSPAVACAAYVAQRTGMATVLTFHSVLRGYIPAFSLMNRWFRWSAWPVAFSAVSELAAADVRRLVGGRRVHVLPNGVDPDFWAVRSEPRADREVRVVAVMRLTPRKRPRALLEMIARVRELVPSEPPLRVHLIGDGPERPAVERLIARLGLADVVELAGRQTRAAIREAYARADVFVLPSVEESFGIAALEARCAGLPVVAMAVGSIGEFIRHGEEGLLARSDAEIVTSLARLVRDAELRASMALRNRGRPPPYSWDDVLAEHLRVYEQAAAERAGGRRAV
ncbi:MAG: glycosyltransferase family 4 protein [Gemmatimonadetes bacterium]|nr:glycosyltransferase family 4 protein [Gemmatimonadota bacterium]